MYINKMKWKEIDDTLCTFILSSITKKFVLVQNINCE